MYVLDTNTLIYYFKGVGRVAEHLLAKAPQDIAIPSIVVYELEYGIAKSTAPEKRRYQLAELCSLVQIIGFDARTASCAAGVRASLESKGQVIGPYDLLIAGSALAVSGVLVTHNTAEFSRVNGLLLEDWF